MAKLDNSIDRMQSVSTLIARKYMLVDSPKFHVVILAELWNLYSDEEKKHFCQNVFNYCKVQNSFNQIPEKENQVLLVSIMDSENNCNPYAYFKNGEIELIAK